MNRLFKLSLIKTARGVILLVAMILLFVLGFDILIGIKEVSELVGWMVPTWVSLDELDYEPRLALGILAFAMPIFFYIVAALDRRLARGIIGRGKSGEDICLTPEAIERAIVREVRAGVPEVIGVRECTATQGTRAARVNINLAIRDSEPVPHVQARVRQIIQDALVRLIGYSDGSQITVKVSRVAPGKASKAATTKKRKKTKAGKQAEA